jgi:hypothetical protein
MPGHLEAGFVSAENFGYIRIATLNLERAPQQNVKLIFLGPLHVAKTAISNF